MAADWVNQWRESEDQSIPRHLLLAEERKRERGSDRGGGTGQSHGHSEVGDKQANEAEK